PAGDPRASAAFAAAELLVGGLPGLWRFARIGAQGAVAGAGQEQQGQLASGDHGTRYRPKCRLRDSGSAASASPGAPPPAEQPRVMKQVVPEPPFSPQLSEPPSAGLSLHPPVAHSKLSL